MKAKGKSKEKVGLIVNKRDMLYNILYQGKPNKAFLETTRKNILSSGIEDNAEIVILDKNSYEECKENIEQLTELIDSVKGNKNV